MFSVMALPDTDATVSFEPVMEPVKVAWGAPPLATEIPEVDTLLRIGQKAPPVWCW
jgi:hypothetical protein